MEKSEECRRYRWSNLATNLLVSIWCHDMVQNQFKMSSRNQPIWESIARYMSRKGFPVTGVQCKTRIKNMLCSYQEAVKKNDPSSIEPYYDIFKKVLSNKNSKKKDLKSKKVKEARYSDDTDNDDEYYEYENKDVSLSSDLDPSVNQSAGESECQMEFLDVRSQDPSTNEGLSNYVVVKGLENILVKAIDSQTKAITNAIKMQSQIIEKLLIAERERLETIMASERESRKQLETRLDMLLSKLEANTLPHVTYMGTLIETRPDQ